MSKKSCPFIYGGLLWENGCLHRFIRQYANTRTICPRSLGQYIQNLLYKTGQQYYKGNTVCPRSLVHFYTVGCYVKMDKTPQTYSTVLLREICVLFHQLFAIDLFAIRQYTSNQLYAKEVVDPICIDLLYKIGQDLLDIWYANTRPTNYMPKKS